MFSGSIIPCGSVLVLKTSGTIWTQRIIHIKSIKKHEQTAVSRNDMAMAVEWE